MRRRRLLNKAKTLLEDESQENEENYARRYLHTNEGNTITPVHKCGSEYTQMWELRHAPQNAVSGAAESGLDGTPCHRALRPLSGGELGGAGGSPAAAAAACCNKKTQSFTTFKPREPIYMRSRAPLNMNMLFRTSGLDTVQHSPADLGLYEARHHRGPPGGGGAGDTGPSEPEQVRLLNGSPSKRPDIICSDYAAGGGGGCGGGGGGGGGGGDSRVTFAGAPDDPEARGLGSEPGLCDHCAMHHSLENVLSASASPSVSAAPATAAAEESEQLSQNPST